MIKIVSLDNKLGSEELYNAETAITEEIENTDSPVFKSESPFDLVKIITGTIMGEPRISFYPVSYEDKFFAKDFVEGWKCDPKSGNKCQKIFKVDLTGFASGDKDLVNYVQNLSLHNDNFTSAVDYAKLLYNFGFYSLKMLAGCIIKINGIGDNSPINNLVKATFAKLAFNLKDREDYFKELLGVRSKKDENSFFTYTENNKTHISFGKCIDIIDELYEHFCRCKECKIELEQIMIILYFSLAFYLLGCAYNLIDNAMIPLKSFYDNDTYKSAADTFIDRTLGKLDAETENKMYSLFYTFYLINQFYEKHTGIKMDDPVFMPLYAIGEKVAKMNPDFIDEKLDISELTQGDLKDYRINFRAYLDDPSFFNDTAIYLSSILEHDNPSKISVAFGVLSIIDTDQESVATINNALDSAISIDTPVSDYTESKVEAFYNYFISIFIETIPLVISPNTYYKLTLFAATFRKIYTACNSGRSKELAALGLMQAEAYMIYLYKIWFKKGVVFKIDDTIQTYDLKIPNRTLKAKAYIQQNAYLYDVFVNSINYNYKDNDYFFRNLIDAISEHYNFINMMKWLNCDGAFDNTNYEYEAKKLEDWKPYIPDSIFDEGNAYGSASVSSFDNLVKGYNKNLISFVSFFFYTKNEATYNLKYISRILELDYNQKTIDTLSKYGQKTDNETVMINRTLLAKLISGNIKEIIKNSNSDERFEYYFNSFLKGMAMIFFAKDSYEHLLGNEKDSYIVLDEETSESDQDHFLSLIPRVSSMRTFNFLNRMH